jgi:hypothetical protein
VHGQAPAGGAKVASDLPGRLCPSPWRSQEKKFNAINGLALSGTPILHRYGEQPRQRAWQAQGRRWC